MRRREDSLSAEERGSTTPVDEKEPLIEKASGEEEVKTEVFLNFIFLNFIFLNNLETFLNGTLNNLFFFLFSFHFKFYEAHC